MSSTSRHPAVGIDLGTTFSTLAYLDSHGHPQTIRNSEGDLTTPSAVFFDRNRPVVGSEAIESGILEPDRLAMFAKRNVGEEQYERSVRGEHLPPEVIQSLVLRKLIADAQPRLGEVTQAVVTVPAFFNEPCRKSTQDAGRLIGLEVLDIINEPTAAAITFGVEHGFLAADGSSESKQTILVYDLGGGTFDVTVMQIDGLQYTALATAGDVYLGGMDWDQRIVDFCCERFMLQHDSDPYSDPVLMQELMGKAMHAKHALTQRDEYPIVFQYDGQRMKVMLSREKFEFLTSDLVDRTILTMQMAVSEAKLSYDQIDRVILVGGSTRMPMVQRAVEKAFGRAPDRSLAPDEAVSHGAAIYAGLLLKHDTQNLQGISVRNVSSHDLGVLGIEGKSGRTRRQIMIPRNQPLPAERSVRFQTHQPNQPNVRIQIVEGGDDSGNDATHIGKCLVDDLPPNLPKGSPVDVQFQYGTNGRLQITASMPDIQRKVRLTLDRDSGLQPDAFAYWQRRIAEGLPDTSVVRTAEQPADKIPDNLADDRTDPLPNFSATTPKTKSEAQPKPQSKSPVQPEANPDRKSASTQDDAQSLPKPVPDFSSLLGKKKKG